jgi:4-amino-4-deoxy-L-arabinose transferase-like glycosyltransferase
LIRSARLLLKPWVLGVFGLALAARLLFLFLAEQPLLYTHQYTYFGNALRIANHPHPLTYILTSEEWRTWDVHWTIAPLYHIFAGLFFRLFGPDLLALRLTQCALDSLTAVAVAALGRQAAASRLGSWAGVLYALYWPAVEMPTWTMTENLHTVLFTVGLALAAREQARPRRSLAYLAGIVLGFASLTRSVSTGFLGLAAVARLRRRGFRRSAVTAALLLAGGATVIAPWTARNVFIIGDPVLVESAAFENLWWANNFVDRERYRRQEQYVHSQPTPAAKRAAALHFALRGIQRWPDRFREKVALNFRHFFRPEGFQNFLGIERSLEGWRHLGSLLLDDAILLVALPLFCAFLLAGRASPPRRLIALWVAYYLFMVVVVFHNEIRYRSAFVPFAFAGVVAGASALRERRGRAALGVLAGLAVSLLEIRPYVVPAWQGLSAALSMRSARAALAAGNPDAAGSLVERAAQLAPRSPRPWFDYGRALAFSGHPAEALAAYQQGASLATPANWRATLALPRLLGDLGRSDQAAAALRKAHRLSWDNDPWLALESAWRELPPPRTNEIQLAGNDYGAVRGFLHPRGVDPMLYLHRLEWNQYQVLPGEDPPPGLHRWTLGHARLRLLPTQPAASYQVTLVMGTPFPSTLIWTEVEVIASGASARRVRLDRELRSYPFPASVTPGQPLEVAIRAPTWSRLGEPAAQGVRVDRMSVKPLP